MTGSLLDEKVESHSAEICRRFRVVLGAEAVQGCQGSSENAGWPIDLWYLSNFWPLERARSTFAPLHDFKAVNGGWTGFVQDRQGNQRGSGASESLLFLQWFSDVLGMLQKGVLSSLDMKLLLFSNLGRLARESDLKYNIKKSIYKCTAPRIFMDSCNQYPAGNRTLLATRNPPPPILCCLVVTSIPLTGNNCPEFGHHRLILPVFELLINGILWNILLCLVSFTQYYICDILSYFST